MAREKKIGKNLRNMLEKNGEKITRGSIRTMKTLTKEKREADIKEGKTSAFTCTTRAVELTSSKCVGQESSKLLFILSLDLVPNPNSESKRPRDRPCVRLERLDPQIEAEARARTTKAIFEICLQKSAELNRKPMVPHPRLLPSTQNITVIDLVSSDEEDDFEMTPADPVPPPIIFPKSYQDSLRISGNGRPGPRIRTRIMKTSSSQPLSQRPRAVFKPFSSQNNRVLQTQLMRRLVDNKQIDVVPIPAERRKGFHNKNNNSSSRSLQFAQQQRIKPRLPPPVIMSSCHKNSAGVASPVVVNDDDLTFGDLPDLSTTPTTWNGHLDGSVGDSSSCSGGSECEYILPEDDGSNAADVEIIIID